MMKWDDEDYGDIKRVADVWRNAISKHGLLFEDMGITYCHFNGQIKSALDHIYFSSKIARNCRKLAKGFSDHFPLMVDLEMKNNSSTKKNRFILKRCYKYFNEAHFLQDLLNEKWDSPIFADPSTSVHEKAALFDKIFEDCLDRHAPIKRIKIHTNDTTKLQSYYNDILEILDFGAKNSKSYKIHCGKVRRCRALAPKNPPWYITSRRDRRRFFRRTTFLDYYFVHV